MPNKCFACGLLQGFMINNCLRRHIRSFNPIWGKCHLHTHVSMHLCIRWLFSHLSWSFYQRVIIFYTLTRKLQLTAESPSYPGYPLSLEGPALTQLWLPSTDTQENMWACVTCSLVRAWCTQPSPRISLHFCTEITFPSPHTPLQNKFFKNSSAW